MSFDVFTYGSLMYDDVWQRVVSGRYEKKRAALYGYVRKSIDGEVYPALIKGEGITEGEIYLSVSSEDILKLDCFEGEMYERVLGQVISDGGVTFSCFFYVFRKEYSDLLRDAEWRCEDFERNGIRSMLRDCFRSDLL